MSEDNGNLKNPESIDLEFKRLSKIVLTEEEIYPPEEITELNNLENKLELVKNEYVENVLSEFNKTKSDTKVNPESELIIDDDPDDIKTKNHFARNKNQPL